MENEKVEVKKEKTMPSVAKEIDVEGAKAALAEANRVTLAQCNKELEEVLRKHNCSLVGSMVVSEQGNKTILSIVINGEQPTATVRQ